MSTYAVLIRVVDLDACVIEMQRDLRIQAENLDEVLWSVADRLIGVLDPPLDSTQNALEPRGDTIDPPGVV